ncbi:MAG: sigma-70 family RNA polymerase sigma factor [Ruminococcus sp.]|nr:sigma-70 family RNA polymerase sigma factor [Ruminococcus sp.]
MKKSTTQSRAEGLSDEEIGEFYRAHCLSVYRVCMAFLGNPADAEDVMQETFLKWLGFGPAENEAHELGRLVLTAENLCRDLLRRRRRFGREDISDHMDLAAEDLSRRDRELLDAVYRLPEKYKTAVFLFYYEDMTVEQISRATGTRLATVKTRLHRARLLLRQELGDEDI